MRNPFEIVRAFESAIAEYTGSPFAVAVDSCTSALFLCCKYLSVQTVLIPARTFFSVPCQILHAGGKVAFEDVAWSGSYQLEPYPIWDSACQLTSGMYQPGRLVCLSFDSRKHLPIGRGGMILTDDPRAAEWLRLARFHGRDERPRMESTPEFAGWKMHMLPEEAARGLQLLGNLPNDNADLQIEYPDLSLFPIYGAGKLVPCNLQNPAHRDLAYRVLGQRYAADNVNITGESLPVCPTRKEFLRHLATTLPDYLGAYIWQEVGEDVAFVFLRPAAHDESVAEIGIFVDESYCGHGIGTRAVSAVLAACRGMAAVARVNPQNQRSNRLFERLGFRKTCNVWMLDNGVTA